MNFPDPKICSICCLLFALGEMNLYADCFHLPEAFRIAKCFTINPNPPKLRKLGIMIEGTSLIVFIFFWSLTTSAVH